MARLRGHGRSAKHDASDSLCLGGLVVISLFWTGLRAVPIWPSPSWDRLPVEAWRVAEPTPPHVDSRACAEWLQHAGVELCGLRRRRLGVQFGLVEVSSVSYVRRKMAGSFASQSRA